MTKSGNTPPAGEAPTPIGKWIGLGVGAGIGSAAIAAALIYANRAKKAEKPRGPKED